jgi:hypothetical protein
MAKQISYETCQLHKISVAHHRATEHTPVGYKTHRNYKAWIFLTLRQISEIESSMHN